MTSRGRLIAFLIGVTIAFALPKRVECGYPSAGHCERFVDGERCTAYQIEPWGFYLLEHVFRINVGFAYETSEDCR